MKWVATKRGISGGDFLSQTEIESVSDSLSEMIRWGKVSISEICGFRLLIEPNICRRAAKYCTDWDLKRMEDMIANLEKAIKSRKPSIVSNMDFLQIIARASQNPLSILIMDAIGEILLEVYKKFSFSLTDHKNNLRFHKKIFGRFLSVSRRKTVRGLEHSWKST
jgi:DNA-binding FadR family transcriptional regulator